MAGDGVVGETVMRVEEWECRVGPLVVKVGAVV